MRNVFSRRDFLKASAAAVLAASAAGVLTGCDGGGEQLADCYRRTMGEPQWRRNVTFYRPDGVEVEL